MRIRCGYSLVECLVAIALATTAITTVAVTMSGMHRAYRQVREQTLSEMELNRFAAQLRADAHRALSANLEEEENTAAQLILSNEETVRYTLQEGRIQRDQKRNDKLVHHESYALPDACTARWEIVKDESTPMLSLRLEPGPLQQSGPPSGQSQQINAAVGLLKQPSAQAKS